MVRFIVPAMMWVSPKSGRQLLVVDGYYTEGRAPNWTRKARYQDWKRHVQECAVLAGMELPLRATKEMSLYVVIVAYFQGGTHPDPGNVLKGVVDALCYVSPLEQKLGVKRGSDKYVGGLFFAPRYDAENPRVEVTVLTQGEFDGMALDHFMAVLGRLIEEEL